MDKRIPAEVFPPGDFLQEELDARGWTQTDLAEILGRPVRLVNEIVMARRAITPETATGLAEALGTSADVWLNLEATWQLSKVRPTTDAVGRRAKLYSKAPVREMIRRGWILDSNDVGVLEQEVLRLFEIGSIDAKPMYVPHAARKATSYEHELPSQTAWVYRARQLAKGLKVPNFTEAGFRRALSELKRVMGAPEEARHIPRILANAGVRFLVVEPLAGCKIDGATLWLDPESPVIALSLRYDRIDNFWFTFLHECKHVLQKDGLKEPIVDVDLIRADRSGKAERPANERDADDFASGFLIPRDRMENFMARTSPLYYKAKIVGFAATIGVHPGIVVGQLQDRDEISFSANREMLVRIRQFVIESALTDGWGNTVSLSAEATSV